MLACLAFAYAETQKGPWSAGVAEPCNTLPHSASDECRQTLGGGGLDSEATHLRRTASGSNTGKQMIASGDRVRIGCLFNPCEIMPDEYASSVASVDSYRH